jgi:hypothetical protein
MLTKNQRDYIINRILAEFALMGALDNDLILARSEMTKLDDGNLFEKYEFYAGEEHTPVTL